MATSKTDDVITNMKWTTDDERAPLPASAHKQKERRAELHALNHTVNLCALREGGGRSFNLNSSLLTKTRRETEFEQRHQHMHQPARLIPHTRRVGTAPSTSSLMSHDAGCYIFTTLFLPVIKSRDRTRGSNKTASGNCSIGCRHFCPRLPFLSCILILSVARFLFSFLIFCSSVRRFKNEKDVFTDNGKEERWSKIFIRKCIFHFLAILLESLTIRKYSDSWFRSQFLLHALNLFR